MEADIKLCEELLAMDTFQDAKGDRRSYGENAADAAAAASGRLTEARRGEILNRLEKHRKGPASSASGSGKSSGPMTAAERRERVQQLLLERQQRLSGASSAVKRGVGASPGGRSPRGAPASAPRRSAAAPPSAPKSRPSPPSRGFITPAKAAALAGRKAVRPSSAPRERPRHEPGVPAPFNLSAQKAGRHSKEAIAARARAEEQKELTFKPRTISRPRSAKSALDVASGEERIARLSTPRTKLWEKCDEIRAKASETETEECTFKPRVGRGPRMARAGPDGGAGRNVPFPDRLYKDGERIYSERERARRQIAEAEVARYPFQPAINDNSRAAVEAEGYRPIHERVGELLRKKQEAMAAARVQVELENPDLTFAPRVSEASRAIARGLEEESGGSVVSGDLTTSRRRRSSSGRRSLTAAEESEYTFAPKLNENTKRLCEMMAEEGVRGGAASFLERQAEHARKSRKEKATIRAQFDHECTFHPKLGNADDVLMHSKRVSRLGETPEERVARLAILDTREKEAKQAAAEENYHKQFTFKPRLSQTARKKEPTPLDDLVANPKGAEIRAAMEAAAREAFAAECTFEPNAGNRHGDAAPRPFQVNFAEGNGITARIREYRREKEICLQEARKEKEVKEMEACTFQPNAGRKKSKPAKSPNVVEVIPGLGRHLELRKRAKQMEDEARAREARVFLEDAARKDIAHRQTVPRSFNLSAQGEIGRKAEERRRRLLAEKEAREKKDCTFRPKTNERPRKELIEKLLAEDDDDYNSPLGREPMTFAD